MRGLGAPQNCSRGYSQLSNPLRTCAGATPAASSGLKASRPCLFSRGWVRTPGIGVGSRTLLGVQGALSHPHIPCSGRALLLLLQADSCAPGRPPLLPGLTLAPQGICPLPWLMDPRNPLESPCTPQAPLGSAVAHPSSGDQPLGFWESAGGLWGIPAFQRHSLGWDWNVFGNPKGINWMCFPEAAGCLCPPAVTAALPTSLYCSPAQRCACSRRPRIFPSSRVGFLSQRIGGGVVWRDGASNRRGSHQSSDHRDERVERWLARALPNHREGRRG